MKYLIIILSILFCNSAVNAQLRLGLKANYAKTLGSSNTIQYGDENGHLLYEMDYISTKDCSSFGLTAYYETGYLFFQGDMMYRKCEVNFGLREYTVEQPSNFNFSETYHLIHLPIAGGVKYGNLRFGVGPIFNLNVQSDIVLDEMELFEVNGRDLSMGFQFMVGYKLHKFVHLDLKFERTFNNVADHYRYKYSQRNLEVSPNILSVGLGFIL